VLELKALQATAGMRPAMTFLADEQLRQAEDAFRRIDGRGCSLSFYLDYLATRPAQLNRVSGPQGRDPLPNPA